ncbi:MAG: hypothetical protein RL654_114 [Pseudomonadota bacterium]|jgi:HK97 family phage portal protein
MTSPTWRHRAAQWLLRGQHPRDPALIELLGGGTMTSAGVAVTPDTAMRVAAVYSCVRVLAESLGSLPLIMYRRKAGGGKERATDHRYYRLVGSAPNGWLTSQLWREMGVASMCLGGAAYSRIQIDAAGRVRLIPLDTRSVQPYLLDSGALAYRWQSSSGPQILLQDEVLRIVYATLDGIKPLSPIGLQRETVGTALAAQESHARFWGNDARPTGGWIEMTGEFKDEEARKKFRAQWEEYVGGKNRGRVAFLKPGMSYKTFQINQADLQYIESQKLSRSQIAGMYRVPPHMIGDLERATFSNIEQQALDFIVHCMGPWAKRWEQSLTQSLLTEDEQQTYFFEFLFDGLLRGDSAARANYFRTAVLTGWMNRNEVREIENMNRIGGLEEFLAPLNMSPADLLAEQIKSKLQPSTDTTP